MHPNVVEKNGYPLSHPQKRIWYNEQLYPETTMHHICGFGEINGKIQIPLFIQSIAAVIRRHEAFRLIVSEQQDEQIQFLSNLESPSISVIDFRPYPDPEEAFNHWLRNQTDKPLPLNGQPPYFLAVYQMSEDRFGIFAKLHHLIFDGWSMGLLTKEIGENYGKLACGETINHSLYPSYLKFIEREQRYLDSERMAKDRIYWTDKFITIPEPIVQIDPDRLQAERKSYLLDRELTSSIVKWVTDHNCSLNDFFILLVNLYLHKKYGRQEFVIGAPVHNRTGAVEKQTIGMFTSTIPLRFHIDPNTTILEMLSSIKHEIRNSYLHQKYPFDLLFQNLQLKKLGYDSLFQLVVNYYPFTPGEQMVGNRFEVTEMHPGQQPFPLQIVIKEWAEGQLALEFDHQTAVFRDAEIRYMYSKLLQLAAQVIEDPNLLIQNVSLLTDEEIERILVDFNDTGKPYPEEKTVVTLFEEQVQLGPGKVALSCGNDSWTYHELHVTSSRLANKLKQLGVGRNSRVGLFGIHSMELVAGILAILKAGASYVPIEHSCPPERMTEIIHDSCLSCVATNIDLPEEVRYDGQILDLTDIVHDGDYGDVFEHLSESGPRDLAYMIYTSGSTGQPKGVMIEHRSLTNYCWWANQAYVQETPAVFAFYSPFSFDLTVTSIFVPLIGGHEMRIYRESDDGFVLHDILQDNKATVLKLTPAHLSLLQDQCYSNSSVQTLIVGGENLKASIAQTIYRQFGGNLNIYNEYGPTEATVGCMIHRYDPDTDTGISVPIGKPADNVQLYVLDEQLKPVPAGSIGELHISGDGVARGYWNRPHLTANSFVPNPFKSEQIMYKTGDLVRFMDNGILEYIGRKDHQVKINGYRIELSEIETRLMAFSEIDHALVLDRTAPDGRKQLCAYLVAKQPVDISVIRTKLSKLLPAYMIPAFFVLLDEIPLTTNGKVDRSRLPAPVIRQLERSEEHGVLSDKEAVLVTVLQDVLGVHPVRLSHDFFELGGDSIKAIHLSSRLKTTGYVLKAKDILAHPCIGNMADYMAVAQNQQLHEQGAVEGVLGQSPIFSWFFGQNFAQPEYYHQSVLLQLDNSIKSADIESAMQQLIIHHDSLRLNVHPGGEPYYNSEHLEGPFQLKTIDLSGLSYEQQLTQIAESGTRLKSEFVLEGGLLVKAAVYNLGEHGRRLLIAAHHLVVDGVSWRILLEDLAAILHGRQRSIQVILPAKTSSYREWTLHIEKYAAGLSVEQTSYWNEVLAHVLRQKIGRRSEQPVLMHNTSSAGKRLSHEATRKWKLQANGAYQTEPVDLLIVALAMAMQHMGGSRTMLLEMEGHGREELDDNLDVSRTVGWFTSMFPVLVELPDIELSGQIKHVKEQLHQVPNKGFDYLIERYINNRLTPAVSEHPRIRFNYLGDFEGVTVSGIFSMAEENTGPDSGPFNHFDVLLDVMAMVVNGQLRLSVTYGASQFNEEWITGLMDMWGDKLTEIVEHCANKKYAEYTPSDFDTVELDQEELDLLLMD